MLSDGLFYIYSGFALNHRLFYRMKRMIDNVMEWLSETGFLRLLAIGFLLICGVLFLLWLFVILYELFVGKR